MRSQGDVRHCRQQMRLFPRIVATMSVSPGRPVWRNGHHERRWQEAVAQVRASRRCFLTTLAQPPLVTPVEVRFR